MAPVTRGARRSTRMASPARKNAKKTKVAKSVPTSAGLNTLSEQKTTLDQWVEPATAPEVPTFEAVRAQETPRIVLNVRPQLPLGVPPSAKLKTQSKAATSKKHQKTNAAANAPELLAEPTRPMKAASEDTLASTPPPLTQRVPGPSPPATQEIDDDLTDSDLSLSADVLPPGPLLATFLNPSHARRHPRQQSVMATAIKQANRTGHFYMEAALKKLSEDSQTSTELGNTLSALLELRETPQQAMAFMQYIQNTRRQDRGGRPTSRSTRPSSAEAPALPRSHASFTRVSKATRGTTRGLTRGSTIGPTIGSTRGLTRDSTIGPTIGSTRGSTRGSTTGSIRGAAGSIRGATGSTRGARVSTRGARASARGSQGGSTRGGLGRPAVTMTAAVEATVTETFPEPMDTTPDETPQVNGTADHHHHQPPPLHPQSRISSSSPLSSLGSLADRQDVNGDHASNPLFTEPPVDNFLAADYANKRPPPLDEATKERVIKRQKTAKNFDAVVILDSGIRPTPPPPPDPEPESNSESEAGMPITEKAVASNVTLVSTPPPTADKNPLKRSASDDNDTGVMKGDADVDPDAATLAASSGESHAPDLTAPGITAITNVETTTEGRPAKRAKTARTMNS